jgi:hypothetical protein
MKEPPIPQNPPIPTGAPAGWWRNNQPYRRTRSGPTHILSIIAALLLPVGALLLAAGMTNTAIVTFLSVALFLSAYRRMFRRRLLVSGKYTVPKYPKISLFLMRNRIIVILFELIGYLIGAIFIIPEALVDRESIRVFALQLCFPIGKLFKYGLAIHLKSSVDSTFRIVVFRRYNSGYESSHISDLLPILGCWGQVLYLANQSLSNHVEIEPLRNFNFIFSETEHPVANDCYGGNWEDAVALQVCMADLIVFDWRGDVTPAMRWELELASANVPLERLVIIAPSNLLPSLRSALSDQQSTDTPFLLAAESLTTDPTIFQPILKNRLLAMGAKPVGAAKPFPNKESIELPIPSALKWRPLHFDA